MAYLRKTQRLYLIPTHWESITADGVHNSQDLEFPLTWSDSLKPNPCYFFNCLVSFTSKATSNGEFPFWALLFAPPGHHHYSVKVDPACRGLSEGKASLVICLVLTISFSVLMPLMCLGCKATVERTVFLLILGHVFCSFFTCIFVCLFVRGFFFLLFCSQFYKQVPILIFFRRSMVYDFSLFFLITTVVLLWLGFFSHCTYLQIFILSAGG